MHKIGVTHQQIQLMLVLILGVFSNTALKATTVYVDITATGASDGTSWADAFISVNTAIQAVSTNDEIHIAAGRYKEGQEILVNKSLTLRGGFPSGGGAQNINLHRTIFDGAFTHRVMNITAETLLEGIKIFNGFNISDDFGGGIRSTANLTLVRCQVVGNVVWRKTSVASGGGVAMINTNALLALHHTRVNGNLAISTSDSFAQFAEGGGIFSRELLLNHSVVHGNRAISSEESAGGGVYISGGESATLIHSRISANQAIHTDSSSAPFGGGIVGHTNLTSSILWGNQVVRTQGATHNEQQAGSLTASHSLIKGQNPAGTANIDATVLDFDPGFLALPNNNQNYNFALQADSILVNAGDNNALPADVYDLDGDGDTNEIIPIGLLGQPRLNDGTVDIGPFELDLSSKNFNSAASHYYFNVNTTAILQDGLSWATAFSSLNDWFYIQDRSNVNTVSIATGHYPTSGTIQFDQAVNIYGGLSPNDGSFMTGRFSAIDPGHEARVMTSMGDLTARGISLQHGMDLNGQGGGLLALQNALLIQSQVKDNGSISEAENSIARGGGISSSGMTALWSTDVIGNRSTFQINQTMSAGSALGGGIDGTNIQLINSRVIGNVATALSDTADTARGGAIFGDGLAINSLVANNQAITHAGSTTAFGAGWHGILDLDNSILWNNNVTENGNTFAVEHTAGRLNANHSLIKNRNPTGTNNIDATDPGFDAGFVAEGLGNFRLTDTSPLLDVADAMILPADEADLDSDGDTNEALPLDNEGLLRQSGIGLDIGPYEKQVSFLVGGNVSGLLAGNLLILQNNVSDDLYITENGPFVFDTAIDIGATYTVSIAALPNNPIQPCDLSNQTGTIENFEIIDVMVACETGSDLIFRNGF